MAKIAVDIDSTLYDFETAAREAMLKLYQDTGDAQYKVGAYHPWTEWRSPADALGLERWLKAIDVCHEADVILSQTPFPGAVETCQALLAQGHDLIYISNRAEGSAKATGDWLDSEGFLPFGQVNRNHGEATVVCTSKDKTPFIADCQYLIDDRLKTCVQFIHSYEWENMRRQGFPTNITPHVDGKRKAFVKGYAYNQAGTDIPGLYVALSWAGLNEYLVSKGVLEREAYRALEAVA